MIHSGLGCRYSFMVISTVFGKKRMNNVQEATRYQELKKWTEDIPQLLPVHNRPEPHQIAEELWSWRRNTIHLDRYFNPGSSHRLLLLHGVGGTGRLLSSIAAPLHRRGYDLIAPDLPGYGPTPMTESPFTCPHWVDMVSNMLAAEQAKDHRPFAVFGLSAGGMLAYQGACRNKDIVGIIATNLLDQRHDEVQVFSQKPLDGRCADAFVEKHSQ